LEIASKDNNSINYFNNLKPLENYNSYYTLTVNQLTFGGNMKKLIYLLLIILYSSVQAGSLDNLRIIGDVPVILKNNETGENKKISLLKLDLTKEHEDELNERINSLNELNNNFVSSLVQVFDLGMENVPVLDQGPEPTCITFAVSALVNAYKKAGDFISQQCLLQFSESIATYECPNAWQGSWSTCILGQIKNYGVVNKKDCPNQYPNKSAGRLDYYTHMQLSNNGQWSQNYNIYKVTNANDINTIKSLLSQKKRILVEFFINKYNNVGDPIDDYKTGLWQLPDNTTNAQQVCGYNMQNCAGHSVVITGYDDNRQLLKVRNSWGTEFGAKGDYYMSYNFFRVMVQRGYLIY
jgi:C1A family cysteine protease